MRRHVNVQRTDFVMQHHDVAELNIVCQLQELVMKVRVREKEPYLGLRRIARFHHHAFNVALSFCSRSDQPVKAAFPVACGSSRLLTSSISWISRRLTPATTVPPAR
jgi:hypothetical protein